MKTNTKFVIATLGVGMAVLLLTGCHHLGGGSCRAPSSAPVGTTTAPANPAQANAPAGHQH